MTGWLRGSWRQFEHGAANKVAAVRNEARLLSARATCVQQALDFSEGLAAAQILRDFRDLELKQVIGPILAVLRECVTVMLASTGSGALIGGVAGAFAGGVGAIPGVALGATLGAQLGELILLLMGLKALTEYIVQDMPEISRNYWHGIREAWLAARLTPLPQQPVHVDQPALRHAAETLARAHVAMLVLLLTGIVAYLAKGRGTAGDLAKSVRGSKLGPGFAEWLVKNEGRLKTEPRLRRRSYVKPQPDDTGGVGAHTKSPSRPYRRPTDIAEEKPPPHPAILKAQQDQASAGYKPDTWTMTTLPKGTLVYGGVPGQSPYYTTEQAVLSANKDSSALFKSLQVAPHPVFGYRPEMGVYRVTEDIQVPTGQALANPALGSGGAQQFFIDAYGTKLQLVDKIPLGGP